jgi:hypothetical protein
MDWNPLEGDWKRMKGKVKEQWGKLTDDDITAIGGRKDIGERLLVGVIYHDAKKAPRKAGPFELSCV